MSGAPWSWAEALATGTRHLRDGTPCQDGIACRLWTSRERPSVLIAALADGAGSAAHAEVGARLAVEVAVEAVHEALVAGEHPSQAPALIAHATSVARTSLALSAIHRGHAISELASTLLVAVLSEDGGAVGQIGDGCVVLRDGDGNWQPVHWPDHGEFANTTRFVTEVDALEALRIAPVAIVPTGLAMFSDGLERLVLDFRARTAHGPFFEAMLTRLLQWRIPGHADCVSRDLADLLVSDKVNRRTDDDKSLLIATRLLAA